MFRQIGMGAAAVLTAGVLAIGCSDGSGDTIIGGGDLRPGNFPGSQVDENNTSSDRRAFTPAGEPFEEGMRVFWNRSNGQAIVLFVTEDDNTGAFNLYASHFDGSRLSPPVNIRGNGNGAIEDPFSAPVGMSVLWVNTAGNATTAVAAKNGDAYIAFTRRDADLTSSLAASEEDQNRRLWLSYFDVSAANALSTGTVVRGFETAAVALDTDIQATGGLTDTDIGTFGWVSDSLHCSHEFTSNSEGVDSGDPTTFVNVFYGKDLRGSAAAASERRFRVVALDLAAATLPAAGGTTLVLGASSFASGEGVDVNSRVLVHNNMMLWEALNTQGQDDVVTVTVFNKAPAGGVATQFNLGEALTANDDSTQLPRAADFYGPDHGVDGYYAFFTASGFSPGGNGERNPDNDLMAAFWPDVASPTREVAEIDAHTGLLDLSLGTDADNVPPRSGALGHVNTLQTRINRSGDYITVLWTQDASDITDADNANGSVALPQGTFRASAGVVDIVNDVLFARVIQTRRPSATTPSTRTLANALSATVHQVPGVFVTTRHTGAANGVTQDDPFDIQFQQALAQGQTTAQQDEDTCDRGCSFQGNHLRMNFIYEAGNDNTAIGTADEDRLMVNGVVVVLGANDTTVPTTTLVSGSEVVVEVLDTSTHGVINHTAAFDAGDASVTGNPPVATTTAGRVIVVFSSNDNSQLDNPVAGGFTERRFYAWEGGTKVTLSTNPSVTTSDQFQLNDALAGITVPVNENTDQAPSFVGTTLHLWWTEDASQGFGRLDLATRSYSLVTTGTTVVALADRFTPPTSDEPAFIDNPAGSLLLHGQNVRNGGPTNANNGLDGSGNYEEFTVVRNGTTVGVFFDEENRIYYQQTSGDSTGYFKDSVTGLARPELVDNESDRAVADFQIESRNVCNDLPGTMVFFMKLTDDVLDVTERVQVRILR